MLADWGEEDISVFDLMYLESEAMMATILRLVSAGIPSLPVYDSLLIGEPHTKTAGDVLSEEFERVCGAKPSLKVVSRETL